MRKYVRIVVSLFLTVMVLSCTVMAATESGPFVKNVNLNGSNLIKTSADSYYGNRLNFSVKMTRNDSQIFTTYVILCDAVTNAEVAKVKVKTNQGIVPVEQIRIVSGRAYYFKIVPPYSELPALGNLMIAASSYTV